MDALATPSNWQRVRLGDIAEIKRGASPRPIENPKWFCTNSNVGWVRISDISKNSRFLYKTAQKLSKKGIEKSRFIKQNSLIMSMCATIGKPIITKIDTCIHDGFVVFENPKIDLNYLYYFLCYIEKEWLESGQQGSQVNLNVDLIKNKEVFCPKDLDEQIAIANILSGLDRYLYSLDALILKKESVKKALSFELLSQRKRLKGFNQAWQRVRLGDITNYLTSNLSAEQITQQGKIKVYDVNNFIGYTDITFISDKPYISIVKDGSVGRVRILPPKTNILSTMGALIANHKTTTEFLFYLLSNFDFKNFTSGSIIPHIYFKDYKEKTIFLPPLNEQIAIANILSALDSEIISLKNKKRQFDNIKKALNHDLMSAKIRVLKK
ncbi:type I restriction endonuclease subunit S [Helicobacter pylori]|uniref:restriction endonuclease subunit S n=1 Tax=Helicobacter pylori TaxID=210 RepID=UPI000BE99D4E|nr:restriction endonuclease subunit S [Helicobacter pylori]PDW28132.1 type I restriction endonuclease subunit S [Helicobacter pylori]PDW36011.1 type I restriction endonuclease subunit S [Helicobacter pylori]